MSSTSNLHTLHTPKSLNEQIVGYIFINQLVYVTLSHTPCIYDTLFISYMQLIKLRLKERYMEDVKVPMLGDKFPKMTVQTTHGKMTLPTDITGVTGLGGKWFVLFSHPADFTPVCTTEFIEFSRRADEFAALNCELVGLSVDQVQAHMKWTEWIEDHAKVHVPFPIIADELGRTAHQLGMISPSKGTNTVRAVYIVDNKGTIRLQLFYPQEAGRNVDEILRILKALQTTDKYGVAAPEKYPNNWYIGSDVIIPPASDENQIQERYNAANDGEITMEDWWFCHKSIEE